MVDANKSFEVSGDGITFENGVHLSSGTAVPTHTAKQGSFYWREGTNDVYQNTDGTTTWALFSSGTGITENRIARGDSGTDIQDSGWSIDDLELMSVTKSKAGYLFFMRNTKGDGGGGGMHICGGELLGDIAFKICDANNTFQLLEVEADQGYIVHGKTYAQAITDNGVAYGYDNQRTGNAKYINTQLGSYRIGGDLVDTQVSSATSTTTTSTSYAVINGMSITPGAGRYLATFSGSGRGQSNMQEIQYCLYAAGSIVAHTERDFGFDMLDGYNEDQRRVYHTQAIITVADSQAIEARWKTNNNTANCFERSLILMKVHA